MPIATSGTGGGGGSGVQSVTAGDTSIVVGGTAADPTVETSDLSTIATDHATAGNVALNSHKITGLANGSASSDAAAFGQLPYVDVTDGSTTVTDITQVDFTSGATVTDGGGGVAQVAVSGGGTVDSVTAADTSIVIGGTAADPTVRTNTLDVIATDHAPAANWSNNSHKITSVADPTANQDAATKFYVDSTTPGNGNLHGKGSLITATGASTPANLDVGADHAVLLADSSQSTGLVWSGALATPYLVPSGAIAETIPRSYNAWVSATPLSSGRLSLFAIVLTSGTVITSVSFLSGSSGTSTATHQIFGLYDSSLNLLRPTNDDTTTTWSALTTKTLTLTSTFTTTYTGLHYVAILVVGGVPQLIHGNNSSGVATAMNGLTPIISGNSGSGLSSLPDPASALSSDNGPFYAWVS
jgi:hypothetical protein